MTAIASPAPPSPPAGNLASARPVVAGRGWRIFMIGAGSIFTALALLAGAFKLLTMIAFDQHFENLTYTTAELDSVEVASISNSTGNINVVGTSAAEATVVVDVGDGLFRARHDEAIEGQTLALEASCPLSWTTRCRVHHDLQLPAAMDVDVHSRIGEVAVADISGDVAINGRFGGVSVERTSGALAINHRFGETDTHGLESPSVTLDTRFGTAALRFAEAPHDVWVTTRFGEVTIEVPDDGTAYRITGSTDFGDRTVDVRVDPDSDRTIHVDSSFGAVTIRYSR